MRFWLASAIVFVGLGAATWFKSRPVQAAQRAPSVQMVPGGRTAVGNPGEKGATYYAIEAQTVRLTTRFRDGHVAVAERGLVGDVHTTVHDANGNERARLRVNRIDDGHDMVVYELGGASALQALSDPKSVKPTLDWVTRQAYVLAKDGDSDLVWDGGRMRPRKAAPRDLDSDVAEIETTWAGGLVAHLTRQNWPRRQIAPGRFVEGPALVSDLTLNGVSAGRAAWFERDKVFAYTLPAFNTGLVVVAPDHLKANYGGWPFTPDATWLSLQAIAMHHFRSLIAKQGFVAKGCTAQEPNRLAQLFMPTLHANEPGCDGFHYLDGTFFRQCCDDHDRCYSKRGCVQDTWWRVWSSWTCDYCNVTVVVCFFVAAHYDDQCFSRGICMG
ncbi:MAG TPA: hypothetical protein VH583_06795 [Vicinamibacterales bacterium]|jgi:hypothetical protein